MGRPQRLCFLLPAAPTSPRSTLYMPPHQPEDFQPNPTTLPLPQRVRAASSRGVAGPRKERNDLLAGGQPTLLSELLIPQNKAGD